MKARKGNAYIMVMVATMAVLMLVVTALLITANSRQITGRYPDFFGLYDLAIGGNEYGIFLLNEGTWATNELPSRVWTVEAEFGMGDGYVVQDIYHARTQVLPRLAKILIIWWKLSFVRWLMAYPAPKLPFARKYILTFMGIQW